MALLVTAVILLWPQISKLANPQIEAQLQEWISSFGVGGWFIMLGLYIFQVIVAFFPSEPFEIAAGVLFGTWGGFFICLLGCVIGSAIVFALVRKYRLPLLNKLFGKDIVESYAFLQDNKKIETVTFILFLLPGTPKDVLTYVAGVSKIKMSRFLVISTVARIPSIITGTMTGGTLLDNWKLALIIFGATILIGLIGIKYKDQIMSYSQKIGGKIKEK